MAKIVKMLLVALAASTWVAAADAVPSLAEPALSPDAAEIAFVSGGDIWSVPAKGGEARLLISHPATESRPLYSPDGKHLAFVSTRDGRGDIYVLWPNISADGRTWIIYTSGAPLIDGSVLRMPHIAVTARDGSPMEMNSRPVDIPVTRPIGESLSGKDSDLDAAVRALLEQIR